MTSTYLINQSESSAEILLYGFIGTWRDTDSKQFISDFKRLEKSHRLIKVRINSGGGDVFEGITIYNTLKHSSSEVHIYIDGLAASMASVIALAGKKIFMSRYAQLMIHRVSGSANGDSDKLRETASLMDELEVSLLDIYATRTGKEVQSIQSTWMQRGKDSWFTAREAVQHNLVDEIFDGVIRKAPSTNKDAKEVWKFYNLQIQNSINNQEMQILNQFKAIYGLPDSATEQDVLAAFQSQANNNRDLKDENEKLKLQNAEFESQLKESQKQKVQTLIDQAIQSCRITEEQRASFQVLAEANFEATKSALNAIAPYKSISSQIQSTSEEIPEYKTFREYQENAPAILAEMKVKDPAKYQSLYKKEFGKLPKNLTA